MQEPSNAPITSADVLPEMKLVRAALDLFIKDAIDYLTACERPPAKFNELFHDQQQAFNDLCRCGRITKRLAHLNDLDPHYISERFRRYVRRYYSEQQPG
ncbi:hypothetical protein SAMN02927930_00105 [Pseudidiomarina indica]|uniref:Uncharacterized protein n=2 Tax=Pseudidiomarina indica TaxID=1159017 RepID=A0A1G6A373_9GAMM|nr:hypothetical protein SAMN02927930_00105 [Pseudidiomarina indica]